MRHLYIVLALFGMSLAGKAQCNPVLEIYENFDTWGETTNECWKTFKGTLALSSIVQPAPGDDDGDGVEDTYFRIYTLFDSNQTYYLVLPQIQALNGTQKLSFHISSNQTDGKIEIGTLTNNTASTSFASIAEQRAIPTAYTKLTYDIPQSAQTYLAIRVIAGANTHTAIYIDDLEFTFPKVDAIDDNFSINGLTGGIAGDVTANDKLGTNALVDALATITLTNNGGLNGVSLDANGNLSVPANTPAGVYTLAYEVCDTRNPTCDTAVITLTVTAAEIIANDDTSFSEINTVSGGIIGDVTANDTLNGQPVIADNLNITLVDNGGLGGLTLNQNGILSVNAGAAQGTYTVTYQICEKLNPNNCDTAIVTVIITVNEIVAFDDEFAPVNGANGGTLGNVLANDTLNGGTPNETDVNITLINNGGLTGVVLESNGNITVPAHTHAGTYFVEYQICEKANPNNCDTATVTIVVTAPEIIANDDEFAPVNGANGGILGNVLANDTLNGEVVESEQVNLALINNGGLTGVVIQQSNGNIVVPAYTQAGTYFVEYRICEKFNPNNCDTAIVTIVVTAHEIIANNDDFSSVEIFDEIGGITGNVTQNDTLAGVAVSPSNITISLLDTNGIEGLSIDENGNLAVPAGTQEGTYQIEYQICEILNPDNCSAATAVFVVTKTMSMQTVAQNQLSYFPNPVQNKLQIIYSEQIKQIEMYDVTGRQIRTINPDADTAAVDFSDLNSGVYFVVLQTQNKTEHFRIVKK